MHYHFSQVLMKNNPIKYLFYSYSLGTCECPFDNMKKDSKRILKLITEYRVIKTYSDSYYSQNTHQYPNVHLNFFLNFQSSWFLLDKRVDHTFIIK